MISSSDDPLVRQLLDGCLKKRLEDQHKLYKHFYSYTMSICLRYAGNKYEAADILNDGFMKAFTHLHKFDGQKPFHLWLRRIMMNTAIDYYRSNLKYRNTYDLEEADHVGTEDTILAKLNYEYASRVIHMLDGKIASDTKTPVVPEEKNKKVPLGKTKDTKAAIKKAAAKPRKKKQAKK